MAKGVIRTTKGRRTQVGQASGRVVKAADRGSASKAKGVHYSSTKLGADCGKMGKC